MASNLNVSAWLVEELPTLAGFEFDDDRGPEMTLCLKSATGAISESSISFG